jgi:hypothetical protein
LKFKDFELDPTCDYGHNCGFVEIIDGKTVNDSYKDTIYVSKRLKNSIYLTSNFLKIQFKTGGYNNYKGFSVTYEAVSVDSRKFAYRRLGIILSYLPLKYINDT